ncbi:hypothetical protein [Microviridae sp.]|nr:hypothetical protein [Microviridae sp.]
MKVRINSHYNVDPKRQLRLEFIDQVSQTVQGESLSIEELLKKEISGMPIGRREVQYLDAESINKISKYYRPIIDPTDLEELKRHNEALQFQIDEFEKHKEELDKDDPDQLKMFEDEVVIIEEKKTEK